MTTKIFTCGECRWFGSVICGFYNIPRIAEDPICRYFQTQDGKIPRFCILMTHIDALIDSMITIDINDPVGWNFRCKQYDTKEQAIEAAKSWLMESDDGK